MIRYLARYWTARASYDVARAALRGAGRHGKSGGSGCAVVLGAFVAVWLLLSMVIGGLALVSLLQGGDVSFGAGEDVSCGAPRDVSPGSVADAGVDDPGQGYATSRQDLRPVHHPALYRHQQPPRVERHATGPGWI